MRFIAMTFTLMFSLALVACGKKQEPAPPPEPAKDAPKEEPAKGNTDARPVNAGSSKITFVGSKDEGKHEGGFKAFTGKVSFDPAALDTAMIEVEIEVGSMWTDDPKLTGHLKSPDFFEVNAHSRAGFKSTKIEKTDDGYSITGDLTIKGKTHTITTPATITIEDGATMIKTSFTINRFDYGIEYGKGKVHDDVPITIELVAK